MEPSTAEDLTLVQVHGQSFAWDPKTGVDPDVITTVEPWIWSRATSLRYPAIKAGMTLEDIAQEGRIGALNAARKFNPFHESGANYLTFAKRIILQRMFNCLRGGGLAMTQGQWEEARQTGLWPCLVSTDEASEGFGMAETLGSLEDAPKADALAPMTRAKLLAALEALEPRDRAIIVRIYGLGREAETYPAVAADYGLSKQRIHQIEARARMRLRVALVGMGVRSW